MMSRSAVRLSIVISSFLSVLLFAPLNSGAQEVFEYRHVKGDQWHLTSVVDEEVLINGDSLYNTEILDKISVKVLEGEGEDGVLWNRYRIAEKALNSNLYAWSEEYDVEYHRDIHGRLSGIGPESPVPTVRDLPVYPDTVLVPGDTWTEEGVELFNLEPGFGIDELIRIRFPAMYEYQGKENLDERNLDKILITYSYSWQPDPGLLQRMSSYVEYPLKISGDFTQEVWWDENAGRNYAATGQFSYTYYMSSGDAITFRGESRGKAYYAEVLNKDAIVKDVEGMADNNISAEATELGVSISLENIHFVPDEAVMLPGEELKLKGIGELLRRYPERDVLVIGHTARVNSESDGQLLSEQRAATVARYLVDNGIRRDTQIVTRGMGNKDPIGDNSTEEGRRKNRRVEIIILEN